MRAMPSSTASSSSTVSFTELRRTSSKRSAGKVRKSGKEKREKRETLEQLKDLVPTVNRDQPMNKLELLQHVIDYIFDLQRQLDSDAELSPSSTASEIDLRNLSSLFSSFVAQEPSAINTAV